MMSPCASRTSRSSGISPAGSSPSSTSCAPSDVEGWPMAELLALADDETRAMWDGLRLGYTESTGHPLLRREIAALYDSVEADDVLVFAGAEEAIYCLVNVAGRAGRSRHRHVARLPEAVRGGPRRRRRRHACTRCARRTAGRSTSSGWAARSGRRRGWSSSTRRTTRRACCPIGGRGGASRRDAPTAGASGSSPTRSTASSSTTAPIDLPAGADARRARRSRSA